jgi:hypothetical protein
MPRMRLRSLRAGTIAPRSQQRLLPPHSPFGLQSPHTTHVHARPLTTSVRRCRVCAAQCWQQRRRTGRPDGRRAVHATGALSLLSLSLSESTIAVALVLRPAVLRALRACVRVARGGHKAAAGSATAARLLTSQRTGSAHHKCARRATRRIARRKTGCGAQCHARHQMSHSCCTFPLTPPPAACPVLSQIDFWAAPGGAAAAGVALYWSSRSTPRAPVPAYFLFPGAQPIANAPFALTAQ